MTFSRLEDFQAKRIHIIGMLRSGRAAAEILNSLGATVTLHDEKEASDLEDAVNVARGSGIDAKTGRSAYEGIANADLLIVSPAVPATCKGILIAQERSVPIISEIELGYRLSPAPMIAITGTNGKTTTTAMLGEIFKRQGRETHVAGNIVAGDIRLTLSRAAFRAAASDVIVAEISSFQLEWISSFRPRVAALLNVSGDHLDRHDSLEEYARVKARIFEYQQEDDHAILNADDPFVMSFAPQIKSRIWQFSRRQEVDLGAFVRGTEVWIRTLSGGEERVCDTSTMKLRGHHNVENVLAAAAAVYAFGGNNDFIQEVVDTFEPLEHRLEPIGEIEGIEFINNSMCTNLLAAIRSLEAIGRPAIVIAGGKGKGDDYTPLGEAFNKYAKRVILIGDDAPRIEEVVRKAGFKRITHACSMEEAVDVAWRHAVPGDSIVLSPGCASFDMFRNFEHRGQVFKAAVASLIERLGAHP